MKSSLRITGARGAFLLSALCLVAFGAGCATGGGAAAPATRADAAVGPIQGRIYEEWFDASSVVLPPPPAR